MRFDPLGLALLVSSLAARRETAFPNLTLEWPRDPGAHQFLREVGFEKHVTGSCLHDSGEIRNALEACQMFAVEPLYLSRVAELFANRVATNVQDEAAHAIQLCLSELLQNVFEHADSRIGAVLFCRWFRKGGNLRLAVVDRGIGIPEALRRGVRTGALREDLSSRTDRMLVIDAVTLEGVSSRPPPRGGGLGLKHLRAIAAESGGRMSVLSLGAAVEFSKGGARDLKGVHGAFSGTAVEIDFRPDYRSIQPGG
jgi:signal transduction histidine kinase